ncbi:kelch-like protein 9 [Branchiostoma floridae]|uniref:Kelch-like protein 9 n=1 Tax=Branchiostoma floridae TaxID=7739 RepID=A0A9J7NB34_BRAFL|nr:kelch-like protein 9 [Branchiostoma floridae]
MASKQVSFTASRSAGSYTSLRQKLRAMRCQSAVSSARRPKKGEEPTIAFVLDDHLQELQAGAQSFWKEDFFRDACVIVEDKSFLAHRLVLAAYSTYFRDIFMMDHEPNDDGMFEISLSGVQAKVADNVIQSMYTSKLNLSSTNVFDVLELADGLKYTVAVQACTKYLKENLNKENCLRTMSLAISYHLDDLKEDSGKFAAARFEEVKHTAGFMALEWFTLRDFIARDDLRATRELQVFQAVVAWLQKDKTKRQKWAVRLMENVRFPLMTPNEVVDSVESVGFLMSVPEFQDLVKEATHYHLTPLRQSILQSPRTNPRSSVRLPAVLGIGGTGNNGGSIMCFTPASGKWRTFTKMDTVPRHHHAVAVLGGFVYIVGGEEMGRSKSVLRTACRYDPRTGEWLTVASMNRCRLSFQIGVLDDFLYAVGGRVSNEESLCNVERYNPQVDRWEDVASISTPRRLVAVATHNHRLYAMGGSSHNRISNKLERYNHVNNHWEQKRPLLTCRFSASLHPVGGRLYLVGGMTVVNGHSMAGMKVVDSYNPNLDQWTRLAPMSVPRGEAGCATLDGKIYVVGGYDWSANKYLDQVECYDVQTDEWSAVASYPNRGAGIACCSTILLRLPEGSDESDGTSIASTAATVPSTTGTAPSTADTVNPVGRSVEDSHMSPSKARESLRSAAVSRSRRELEAEARGKLKRLSSKHKMEEEAGNCTEEGEVRKNSSLAQIAAKSNSLSAITERVGE